jgi:hypothetical protein
MNRLRTPIFLLALILIFAIVQIERQALSATTVASYLPWLSSGLRQLHFGEALEYFSPEQQETLRKLEQDKAEEVARLPSKVEGFGVESLQYVDAILLFTLALMTLALLIPAYLQAKVQGCITLIFAILLILAALVKVFIVLAKLLLMVALLLAFPFGTLAYLIIYGSFPRGAAIAVVNFLFTLKLLFGILLLLAHQRFIENKGLVIFFIASLVANVVITFLYNLVPGFLVSITDAIAAIVVMIIGIILAILLAIGAIVSIVLALKPR